MLFVCAILSWTVSLALMIYLVVLTIGSRKWEQNMLWRDTEFGESFASWMTRTHS